MPWNNQGGSGGSGGPWGPPPSGGGNNNGNGNGNSPWGRPSGNGGGGGGRPSGPGGTPPDLEDIFRKGQDRFKQAMPGGFGGGRGIAIILVLLVGVWALTGFYRVQPDENGVVMRFGEWVRTTPPGLHYHLPFPIESVEKPPVTRVNIIEIGFRTTGGTTAQGFRQTRTRSGSSTDVLEESLMLTGDENIIDIDFAVQWRIADPEDFLFNIRRPADTVQRAAESAMREVIGRTDLQPALTEARTEIEIETREIIQSMLDDYQAGVEITAVQLQDVKAPEQVIDAFDDVQRARADRERARNEAEAYRNDIIPRARGNAERVLQEAQAYREQVVARATGDAQRFEQIFQAYEGAKDVTLRRLYLETLEEVLANANKIIVENGAGGANGGGGTGVVPYLPLDQLTRGNNARRPSN
ncbi:MAG: FtsH protease activity modulator HflK [Pseudomonadota bacterium]